MSRIRRHAKPLVLGLVTMIAYVAAINRLQILPWIIAAILTSTLIVGTVWPHWLVKRLSVVRKGPARAEEGETISFDVEVENHGWLPRFMVELVDHLPFIASSDGRPAGAKTLGVVSCVPGRSKRRFDVSVRCEKRGYYQLGPAGLASSFPLGLAEARQYRNDGVQSLTVYPDVFPIVSMPLRGALSQIHRGGHLLPEGAGAAEFSGLREYRRGDNPRHIHWLTTARLNELMVKEFEPLASACLYLVLDQASETNLGRGRYAIFEYAVRIAASIAKYACAVNIPTRLIGQGKRTLYLPVGSGENHYQRILDELAVVAADAATPYAAVLRKVEADCQHGETVVVFVSESGPRLKDTLQTLALLRARGANVFALVFERNTFDPNDKAGDDAQAIAVATLLDLGAFCLSIRCGDDLVKLFNA
jgi:uncharacterized protein (DUF58 family)